VGLIWYSTTSYKGKVDVICVIVFFVSIPVIPPALATGGISINISIVVADNGVCAHVTISGSPIGGGVVALGGNLALLGLSVVENLDKKYAALWSLVGRGPGPDILGLVSSLDFFATTATAAQAAGNILQPGTKSFLLLTLHAAIGWPLLLRGYIAKSWTRAYSRLSRNGFESDTTKRWSTTIINCFWTCAFAMWKLRCQILHDDEKASNSPRSTTRYGCSTTRKSI
jgi:hypothetical protein